MSNPSPQPNPEATTPQGQSPWARPAEEGPDDFVPNLPGSPVVNPGGPPGPLAAPAHPHQQPPLPGAEIPPAWSAPANGSVPTGQQPATGAFGAQSGADPNLAGAMAGVAPTWPHATAQPTPGVPGSAPTAWPDAGSFAPPAPEPARAERVGRGLLLSLAAWPVGMALAIGLWKIGFVASLTSWAQATAAVWLYAKGAGADPRKGRWPLLALTIVGVVASFVAIMVSEILPFANRVTDNAGDAFVFTVTKLFDPQVLAAFAGSGAMFILFGLLGLIGLIVRRR